MNRSNFILLGILKLCFVNNKIITVLLLLIIGIQPISGQSPKGKIHRLRKSLTTATESEKVLIFDSLSRAYWDIAPDTSLLYAQNSLEIAKKLKNNFLLGEAHNSMGNAYGTFNEHEKSILSYQKSKEFREKDGNMINAAKSLGNIGVAYLYLGRYTESIESYKQAIEICEKNEDFLLQASYYSGIAEIYYKIRESNKALEYSIKAANIFIHYKDKEGLASSYAFIGSLHHSLSNNSLALEYYLKAYELHSELNNINGISRISNNLGIVYDDLNETEKALEYYNKALELSQQLGRKKGISLAYNNIGFLYVRTKMYNLAKQAYFKSLEISHNLKEYSTEMNTLNNIAKLYYVTNNYSEAEVYVNKALELNDKVNDIEYTAESHEILGLLMEKKKNYIEALYHTKKLLELRDSLYSKERNQQVLETQTRFDTERKEKEIQLLRKDNAISDLENQKYRNFLKFSFALSIIFILFSILFFRNSQAKKKTNKMLSDSNKLFEDANKRLLDSEKNLKELNATKDKFFSIIAHDLKNPFAAVMGFSEALHKNFSDFTEDEKRQYIGIIYDSSVNLYKLLENLLQWSRSQLGTMPINPEFLPIQPIISEEIENFSAQATKKSIKISSLVDSSIIAFSDKNLVAIIVRNLMGNAIKFTPENGKITIYATERENFVEISISDSGVGLSNQEISKLFLLDNSFTTRGTDNETGTGLGLIICKELIEKSGGQIEIKSEKGIGSTFTFTLPKNHWK